MKARHWMPAVLLALLLAGTALVQVPPLGAPLVRYLPPGALLTLEARDFGALLRDWNGSNEKALWLASDNYRAFVRSRLLLRLEEAQGEFAQAAGVSPDLPLVESIAGSESALGLYDIGNLQLLYITRLGSARALENALWQSRASFEPRSSAGKAYYLRSDAQSGRVAGFAATDDFLLIATREDLLSNSLALLSGQSNASVTQETWFADSAAAAPNKGELRLTLNVESLVKSPHFRSYWIQRNVSELSAYRAGVADVFRASGEWREERVFLRTPDTPGAPASDAAKSAAADLIRLAPQDAGLYRVWAAPNLGDIVTLIRQKILAPKPGDEPPSRIAPIVAMNHGVVGHEGALETRIDVPPPVNEGGAFFEEGLLRLVGDARVEAMLQTQTGREAANGVFAGNDSAAVLLAELQWNPDDVRRELQTAVEGIWTTSGLGTAWLERRAGEIVYHELDGLSPLAVAVRGRHLFIANGTAPLIAVLNRLGVAPPAGGDVYSAGFRHRRERPVYGKLMRGLDYLYFGNFGGEFERPPAFFSENVGSLSTTLARVESETITQRDEGASVFQTVTYRLSQ